MRVIYTSKGMSKKLGVRVIYRKIRYLFYSRKHLLWRSQCPRDLRRRSAAAHLLRLWVRIPPGAWMSLYCECCVLLSRNPCDKLITRPERTVVRLWVWSRNLVNEEDLAHWGLLRQKQANTYYGSHPKYYACQSNNTIYELHWSLLGRRKFYIEPKEKYILSDVIMECFNSISKTKLKTSYSYRSKWLQTRKAVILYRHTLSVT
jgi:hypothetical protein